MKIDLEASDIERIVEKVFEKVVEHITPLLKQNLKSNDKGNDDELLTVDEVANRLKKKPQSIYDKVYVKSIPFLKIGNHLRFKKKHIDIWIRNPYSPELEEYNLNHNGRKGVK